MLTGFGPASRQHHGEVDRARRIDDPVLDHRRPTGARAVQLLA
jgi:hypothetical protein